MKRFLTASIISCCAVAHSASLADSKKVFSSGSWSVLRGTDSMTDKATCTGVYKKDYSKQLSADTLYISIRGGISSVTMRFDDEPPRGLRLATETEKGIDAITVNEAEFDKLLQSSRLRMRVSTLVSGIQDFDIDLRGLNDAVENIRSGCPEKSQPAGKKNG
ncbi:hypothetical protein [Paracidovorax cattleyae]|uniref:hypothetical protein n=1 Tax=Paracidovorax cattleyae TaxID=80868 RepID=UPI00115FA628|nr:hypothetical protein [Paracidovorax cattleyae]